MGPCGAHGRGRAKYDLTPLGGAIDHRNHVANLGSLKSGSGNVRFLEKTVDLNQPGEVESSSDAAELTDFAGQRLLSFDPGPIRRGGERSDAVLPERRRGVASEEIAKGLKFEDARRAVGQSGSHRKIMLQEV